MNTNIENAKQRIDILHGRTPLHAAAWRGDVVRTEQLLKNNADVNARASKGQTPLHNAAEFNKPDIVRMLLDFGAIIDSRDSFDATPLHTAAWSASADAVRILISQGADVNAQAKKIPGFHDRVTPLELALDRLDKISSQQIDLPLMKPKYEEIILLIKNASQPIK